jgi:uncharacterized protein (TIGR03032 family)
VTLAGHGERLWAHHHAELRDPAQIASHWESAATVEAPLLRAVTRGAFWDTLDRLDLTLLVSREYEHLVMALAVQDGRPHATFLRLPHPSGIAVDTARRVIHVASTRNPNQVFDFEPVAETGLGAQEGEPLVERPLLPLRSRMLPGSLHLHDLALIGGRLHANAVGQNAVVRLGHDGRFERVWWPRSIELDGEPDFTVNHLQLNSIAAGRTLKRSFYSASAAAPGRARPGQLSFRVDGRGVIFDGSTREPLVTGLTRPHSARLRGDELWVNSSGYGEVGRVSDGRFEPVARLPGWTRGLCMAGNVAAVATSRVIPRYRCYAPGLDVDRSVCGVHLLDVLSGESVGSLRWPLGNQVFAVEAVHRETTLGFPFRVGRTPRAGAIKALFSGFRPPSRRP